MSDGPKIPSSQADRLHKFAHDIRNRLSGLHQALTHVADGTVEDKKELVEFGEQQFFKALREVESLLDDLQVERGEQEFEMKPVPLASVVKEAVDHIRYRFENKDQELRLKLDPSVEVKGDRHYISGSVSTLLSNASKFSPRQTPVEVVLERRNDHAELCVIDQGVGLTEEDLKNIFVRYAWLNSRSTDGEAQGRSSLSKAHKWAQGMGGELTATSEGAGKGCAFSLRLPLA